MTRHVTDINNPKRKFPEGTRSDMYHGIHERQSDAQENARWVVYGFLCQNIPLVRGQNFCAIFVPRKKRESGETQGNQRDIRIIKWHKKSVCFGRNLGSKSLIFNGSSGGI